VESSFSGGKFLFDRAREAHVLSVCDELSFHIMERKYIAYIDGANLHKGIQDLGWRLDYRRFRIWLEEKYGIRVAYLFIGMMSKNASLYTHLQECGYTLIFKETTYDGDGKAKGNCDAELVLRAVSDIYENNCDHAILVTGDGDFACLVDFLLRRNKLRAILAPNHRKCSILLKRTNARITYLEELHESLSVK
jgi:uncharacterized LabA/DUF88 family protein